MSDNVIGIINGLVGGAIIVIAGVLHAFDVPTFIVLSIGWFLPIIVWIAFVLTKKEVFCSKYTISWNAFRIFVFSLAIVSLLLIHYDFYRLFSFGAFKGRDVWGNIGIVGLVFFFIFVCIYVIKGFVLVRIDPENEKEIPLNVSEKDLPAEGFAVIDTIEKYSQIVQEYRKGNYFIRDTLHIPPYDPTSSKNAPLEYITELSSIPEKQPNLAGLEQFALMVADNSGVDELLKSVGTNLQGLAEDGVHYAEGMKDILAKTIKNTSDFFHSPDGSTAHELLVNIYKAIDKDIHRSIFAHGLSHANGFSGKLGYVAKHLAGDVGKGTFETFHDEGDLHNLNDSFMESFDGHIDDIVSAMPTGVDVDIWDPDFDGSAHFPIITTAIEGFKLLDKYTDGDVDMSSALEKSATKVGLTAGGAGIGSIIGTAICPGLGTAIGAMVGGWLGKWSAKKINTAELERLQDEFYSQQNYLQRRAKVAESNIETYRNQTNDEIKSTVDVVSLEFEELKKDAPLTEYDKDAQYRLMSVGIRFYLANVIESNKDCLSKKEIKEIHRHIPSSKQIADNPKESMMLLLSAENSINEIGKKEFYRDFSKIVEKYLSNVVYDVVMTETMQAVWYYHILNSYKSSLGKIMQETNDSIAQYIKKVNQERVAIDKEIEKLEEIKKKVEEEAKTL